MSEPKILLIDEKETLQREITKLLFKKKQASNEETHGQKNILYLQGKIRLERVPPSEPIKDMIHDAIAGGRPFELAIVHLPKAQLSVLWELTRNLLLWDEGIEVLLCYEHSTELSVLIERDLPDPIRFAYLGKPFHKDEIKTLLLQMIEKYRIRILYQKIQRRMHDFEATIQSMEEQRIDSIRQIAIRIQELSDEIQTNGSKTALAIQAQQGKTEQNALTRLHDFSKNLLNYTHLHNSKSMLREQPFHIEDILSQCDFRFRPLFDIKQIEFGIGCDPSLSDQFMGDVDFILQAVTLLLDNALRFTQHGFVSLNIQRDENLTPHLREEHSAIRIIVSDSGLGMNQDQVASCCDFFSRGAIEKGSTVHQSGLGLQLCKDIVLTMRGSLGIDSVPGQGTTIWIILPLRLAASHTLKVSA